MGTQRWDIQGHGVVRQCLYRVETVYNLGTPAHLQGHHASLMQQRDVLEDFECGLLSRLNLLHIS